MAGGGYGPPPGGGPPGYGPPPAGAPGAPGGPPGQQGFGPPGGPPAYGPPGGGPPPPGGGGALNPGQIEERSSAMVIVLFLVTCGIYGLYWLYKTSEELKNTTNDPDINPVMDLIITIICGFYGIYVMHRNATKTHAAIASRNPGHKDQSQMILIMHLLGIFVTGGITSIIAVYMLQEEFNTLGRTAG